MRLASVLPLWAALLITFVIWFLLVASMTASCGSELLDIVVGSVTIIIVMTLAVEAGIRMWQRRHQKPPPAAANQSVEPTSGSRYAQSISVSQWRLPPVAHAWRSVKHG
jgi:hypothetical protein